ncbi:hypothetical protein DESPIG_02551 [Desulfovibrio piger ATCC 29098]|uniref:Uncharacterized protein n=1 Tax=Desulfovibrio piger ATCC 29098 TaxID=411464 RepID=B6WWT3_9BACT|nr:hypothetical protein DESPIG_02551 [Desulfovibrio piger ATCC 29098]
MHGKLLKRRGWSVHATRGRDACPCAGERKGEPRGEVYARYPCLVLHRGRPH